MQRRFIGGLKENLKALKQEFTGADIYNGEVNSLNIMDMKLSL